MFLLFLSQILCKFFGFMYLCVRVCARVCVYLCSHCCAEDRATGEIPLNYTQVVINYRWHFGHINDFNLKWGPTAAVTKVHHACVCVNECVCMCNLKCHHLWLCSQLSRKRAHMNMWTHTLAWACCWARVSVNLAAPSSTLQGFDEHTHYAKKSSMPGLPCAFRKG